MDSFRTWMTSAVILLASTAAASAQNVGDVLRDRVQLDSGISRETEVPLPPGDWVVVARDWDRAKVSDVRLWKLRLVQVRDHALTGYIFITWNDEFPNYGWT